MKASRARAEKARFCDDPRHKVRFRTHEDASRALASLRRVTQDEPIPVRAYKCPTCGGWHLTSLLAWRAA